MGNFMINYSVFLLQNQMNKGEAPKAYARAQVKEVMSFNKFCNLCGLNKTLIQWKLSLQKVEFIIGKTSIDGNNPVY